MMSLARLIAMTKVGMYGHVLNWFWRDRVRRRKIRGDVISAVIPQYFKRYLPAAAATPERKVVKNDKNEKIFSIWLQGEENAPGLVKACFRSIRKNCRQELVVLDEKTLPEYITLPDFIWQKRRAGKIHNAHFADICRVELLYEYGGIWMDSTCLVTAPIPDWIIKEDFFVFMAGHAGSPYSFMQNCFIRARRGAYLLDAWRAMMFEFWKNENRSFDYFMHQLLFKTLVTGDERAKQYFAKMPHIDQDPTHMLWWAYKDKPFDKKIFDKITSGAVFQKLTYRGADNSIPGSFADYIINKLYK